MLSQPNYFMIGCKESGAEKNLTFFCEGIQKVSHKEAQFWPKKLAWVSLYDGCLHLRIFQIP